MDTYIVFGTDQMKGIIDRQGNVILPPVHFEVHPFREGLAAVFAATGRHGFVDEQGQWAIEPIYRDSGHFAEGLCAVANDALLWGFIDRAGREVISPRFPDRSNPVDKPYFSEGLCPVISESLKKWGYVDRHGETAIDYQFEFAGAFSEGLAVVEGKGGKYGFIDKTGTAVWGLRWKQAWAFSNGVAAVAERFAKGSEVEGCKGRWGLIDHDGNFVSEPIPYRNEKELSHQLYFPTDDPITRCIGLNSFHEQRAPIVQGGKWGYLNPKGVVAIPPRFSKATHFAEGVALVRALSKGKDVWNVIDVDGKIVSTTPIEQAEDSCVFGSGLAPAGVRIDGNAFNQKWGFVDRTGAFAIPPQYERTFPFRGGLALVLRDGAQAYVDVENRPVWQASGKAASYWDVGVTS
jgi:hypothetical protein